MKSTPIIPQHQTKSSDHQRSVQKARLRDVAGNEEMSALLSKLRDLVPNMPKNRKLSKLEIIQYVIDYIMDLQTALETHPASRGVRSNSPSGVSPNRQPLGVLSTSSNTLSANTCAAQEACHLDKVPIITHLTELVASTRQVSC